MSYGTILQRETLDIFYNTINSILFFLIRQLPRSIVISMVILVLQLNNQMLYNTVAVVFVYTVPNASKSVCACRVSDAQIWKLGESRANDVNRISRVRSQAHSSLHCVPIYIYIYIFVGARDRSENSRVPNILLYVVTLALLQCYIVTGTTATVTVNCAAKLYYKLLC